MARRTRKAMTPDIPDLPPDLEPGPGVLSGGERLDGVQLSATTQVPDRVYDLDLVECRLTGTYFAGRRVDGFRARDVVFDGCDLAGTVFVEGCELTRVRFEGCRMTGLVLAGARLTDIAFRRGTAKLANFRDIQAVRVWAVDTVLREADFSEATLKDCAFLDCDLTEADFRQARVSGLSLHGSLIEQIRSATALSKGVQISEDQIIPLGLALVREMQPAITSRPDC